MKLRTKTTLALLGGAGALAFGATALAGGEDKGAPQQARDAALAHTGGGRVTETEVGDEESYYEVEVTRADGSQVDVQLNRSFEVVGAKADREDD
jgi:hypothetical protein